MSRYIGGVVSDELYEKHKAFYPAASRRAPRVRMEKGQCGLTLFTAVELLSGSKPTMFYPLTIIAEDHSEMIGNNIIN